MSGGGNGGGNYQPQDNTAQLIAAQMDMDRIRRHEATVAEQERINNEKIAEQQRIDADKHAAQVANNERLVRDDRLRREALEDDAREEAQQIAYEKRIADAAKAEQDRLDKIKADEKAAADAKETARLAKASGALTLADTSTRDRAKARLAGLNATDLYDEIDSEYDRIKGLIPEGTDNPGSYYTDDVLNNLIATTEADRRSKYTAEARNAYGAGFEDRYIPYTADDSYINNLLTGRKKDAQQSIDFARSRGQLNDAGYAGALSKLGEQEKSALGTLTNIGNSVLGTKRSSLQSVRDDALSNAGSYTLGNNPFDIAPYNERLTNMSKDALSSLEGDIMSSLGNTSLFNINDIILAGGRGQGPQNLTTANIPARLRKQDTDRGLGTTGTF